MADHKGVLPEHSLFRMPDVTCSVQVFKYSLCEGVSKMKRLLSVLLLLALLIGVSALLPDAVVPAAAAENEWVQEAQRLGPTIIDIKALSPNSVRITWTRFSGVKYYQVRYRQLSQRKYVAAKVNGKQNIKNTNTITVTGLKANTLYFFEVRAANTNLYKKKTGYAWTTYSDPTSIRTPQAVPAIPYGVGAYYSSANKSVVVEWNDDNRASGCEVQMSQKGLSPWGNTKSTTSNSCTYTSGLVSGKTMAFRVRAYYYSGSTKKYTNWSSTVYVDIPAVIKPFTPSITAVPYGNGQILITVTNPCTSTTGYEFQWGKSGLVAAIKEGSWPHKGWASGRLTQFTISGSTIELGTEYAIRVRAVYEENGVEKYTSWSAKKYVTPNDGVYTTRYQVVYRGGLYINELMNRKNCDKRLMKKGEYFWVDLTTSTRSGSYVWAKAKYGNYYGWVAISEPSYCVPK